MAPTHLCAHIFLSCSRFYGTAPAWARAQIKCIIMQISCRFDKTIKRNPTVLRPHSVTIRTFSRRISLSHFDWLWSISHQIVHSDLWLLIEATMPLRQQSAHAWNNCERYVIIHVTCPIAHCHRTYYSVSFLILHGRITWQITSYRTTPHIHRVLKHDNNRKTFFFVSLR